MTSIVRTQTLAVASGATVSSVFQASGFSSFGVALPSDFQGTSISFEVASLGSTTFTTLYNLATAVSLTVAASRAYALPADLTPFPAFRIVTPSQGTSSGLLTVFGKSQ